MKQIKLEDLDIYEIGNSIQLSGAVYSGNDGKSYLVMLPGEEVDPEVELLSMDLSEWERFLRQTDLLEVEIVQGDTNKKAILRKSQRQIDQGIMWDVFKRDNYTCRYCGKTGLPLTVDHLVLWEEGGETTTENLNTACKKCNKKRGNMQYGDWLKDSYYLSNLKNLKPEVIEANEDLEPTLAGLPRKKNIKNR